jgi:hypothetical protein
VRRVEALISQGRPSEVMVAEMLQQYPADRPAILALLNHTLGHSYARGVLAARVTAPDPIEQATAILAAQVQVAPAGGVPSAAATSAARPSLLVRLENAITATRETVVRDAATMAGGTEMLAISVGQHLEVVGGEAVGVAELAGVRYPVKTYEAQVDGGLYRGSRLDDAGMAALKQQGVQGVVSLCLEHTEDAVLAAKYGIAALNVKVLDNSAPTIAQMNEFIAFARAHPPTYVHCEAGQGRTGTAVACYRIAVDRWTADQAIAEARSFGLSLINQIAFVREFAQAGPTASPVSTPASTTSPTGP